MTLKRFEQGLTSGEATLAATFLFSMIAVAALQVVVDNAALRFGAEWAQAFRQHLGWIDPFMKRGTVVLAFIGASLAVSSKKHIAIDAIGRVLPAATATVLRAALLILAGVVCTFLSRVFYEAALSAGLADAQERALDVYLVSGTHVCDAAPGVLAETELSRPGWFCRLRDGLGWLGITRTETLAQGAIRLPAIDVPEAMFRFVAPVMLLLMAVRFGIQGVSQGWDALHRAAPSRADGQE